MNLRYADRLFDDRVDEVTLLGGVAVAIVPMDFGEFQL